MPHDTKDAIEHVLQDEINALPRTRSGRGWFISAQTNPVFVQTIMRRMYEQYEIVILNLSYYFEQEISRILVEKHFNNEQEYADAIILVAGLHAFKDTRRIIEKAIDELPHAGYWHRRISNEYEKKQFISHTIDELFKKSNHFIIQDKQNILLRLVPLLIRERKVTSAQDCAEKINKLLTRT